MKERQEGTIVYVILLGILRGKYLLNHMNFHCIIKRKIHDVCINQRVQIYIKKDYFTIFTPFLYYLPHLSYMLYIYARKDIDVYVFIFNTNYTLPSNLPFSLNHSLFPPPPPLPPLIFLWLFIAGIWDRAPSGNLKAN